MNLLRFWTRKTWPLLDKDFLPERVLIHTHPFHFFGTLQTWRGSHPQSWPRSVNATRWWFQCHKNRLPNHSSVSLPSPEYGAWPQN
ncbi:hypothetical protein Hanom_Chr12g01095481 [Helianthus anomalus]